MITKCPNCNSKFRAQDAWKGHKTKCPKCSELFTIAEFVGNPIPPPDKPNIGKKLELCTSCGRMIGKLEKSYVFKNTLVCTECGNKVRNLIPAMEVPDSVISDRPQRQIETQRSKVKWWKPDLGSPRVAIQLTLVFAYFCSIIITFVLTCILVAALGPLLDNIYPMDVPVGVQVLFISVIVTVWATAWFSLWRISKRMIKKIFNDQQ